MTAEPLPPPAGRPGRPRPGPAAGAPAAGGTPAAGSRPTAGAGPTAGGGPAAGAGAELRAVIDRLGLVDQHCHSLLRGWAGVAGAGWPAWRRCFSEAAAAGMLAGQVGSLLGYRHFLATLAAWLDVGAAAPAAGDLEPCVVAERDRVAAADPDGYLRRLLDDGGVGTLLVDTGFGGSAVLGPGELAQTAGRPVRELVRLETVAERLLGPDGPAPHTVDELVDAFLERLAAALDAGAVGLKSIAAYRGGLALAEPDRAVAVAAFDRLDRRRQAARFDDRVLEGLLVWRAAELAAGRGVPLQFHTGFGDPDLDLATADPSLLRPLLHDPRTEACPVVLLHCYPYVGQAACLAAVYPQVWLDLSLAIPLAEPLATRLVGEALGLCPAGKLLAASDGHSYPEMHWWGALVWRRALAETFARELERGALGFAEAVELAQAILGGNARRLYRL